MPDTFKTALLNIPNQHTTDFAVSYLKQVFKRLSTFLPYRDIKILGTLKTVRP